jgi:hypothetical protein
VIPDEAFNRVLAFIADGDSVASACKRTGACDNATFFRRVRSNPELNKRWQEATEERAAIREQRYGEVLDKLEAGSIDPQSARVLLDGIKFQMQNDDRRYQEKVRAELTGRDGKDLIPAPKEVDLFEEARYLASVLWSAGVNSLDQAKPLEGSSSYEPSPRQAALLGCSTK